MQHLDNPKQDLIAKLKLAVMATENLSLVVDNAMAIVRANNEKGNKNERDNPKGISN